MPNGKIFISYRREDTSGESGRLKDKLELEFGKNKIFYDVETLEAGLNFEQTISLALNESKVLLAMIGPHWLKVADSNGNPRIFLEEDWVRKEISKALGKGIRVIPVLVNGAKIPSKQDLPEDLIELSMKHAQELSSSRWNYDVSKLVEVLKKEISSTLDLKTNFLGDLPEFTKQYNDWSTKYRAWFKRNYVWVLGIIFILILMDTCSASEEYYPSY
jgi:hypothetical protein